jgi:hypothetical protein
MSALLFRPIEYERRAHRSLEVESVVKTGVYPHWWKPNGCEWYCRKLHYRPPKLHRDSEYVTVLCLYRPHLLLAEAT